MMTTVNQEKLTISFFGLTRLSFIPIYQLILVLTSVIFLKITSKSNYLTIIILVTIFSMTTFLLLPNSNIQKVKYEQGQCKICGNADLEKFKWFDSSCAIISNRRPVIVSAIFPMMVSFIYLYWNGPVDFGFLAFTAAAIVLPIFRLIQVFIIICFLHHHFFNPPRLNGFCSFRIQNFIIAFNCFSKLKQIFLYFCFIIPI